jgi:hypothetical protein
MGGRKIEVFRLGLIYLFAVLTLVCSFFTFYYAFTGDASLRNSSAVAAIVGMILVYRLRKDGSAK